jgi:hypothetical protein
MQLPRRAGAALGAVIFAAVMTAAGLPAQAASGSGWREAFARHYGAAADVSGLPQ